MPALSIVSAAAGRRLKEEGQALTLAHAGDWKDKALAEFKAWCRARLQSGQITITMEEFRADAKPNRRRTKAGAASRPWRRTSA